MFRTEGLGLLKSKIRVPWLLVMMIYLLGFETKGSGLSQTLIWDGSRCRVTVITTWVNFKRVYKVYFKGLGFRARAPELRLANTERT